MVKWMWWLMNMSNFYCTEEINEVKKEDEKNKILNFIKELVP